jgi:quercetin dioxygenase-like cupin family protein
MYEITLKPGDTVALHNHPDHSMYVIQGGKLSIGVQGGETKEFDMKPGMGMMTGPENHNGKNVGNTTVKLLLHDIYRPRGK